jgi:hypothetical protein
MYYKIIENKQKYYMEFINLLELNNKKLEEIKFIDKVDDILNIINDNVFRTLFNTNKIDKTELYDDENIETKINTKLLLGKINSIFDNFGIQMKSFKTGDNNNRKYYYKLKPLHFMPKKYIDYFKLIIIL